jgi:hypothetical protein
MYLIPLPLFQPPYLGAPILNGGVTLHRFPCRPPGPPPPLTAQRGRSVRRLLLNRDCLLFLIAKLYAVPELQHTDTGGN